MNTKEVIALAKVAGIRVTRRRNGNLLVQADGWSDFMMLSGSGVWHVTFISNPRMAGVQQRLALRCLKKAEALHFVVMEFIAQREKKSRLK